MKRGAWGVAWIVVAVWTLLMLGIYVVFDLLGDLLVDNAGAVTDNPTTAGSLSSIFDFLRDVGVGALIAIWAVVTVIIFAIAAIGTRLVGKPAPRPPYRR
jgi:choline-glycine betaine transporter